MNRRIPDFRPKFHRPVWVEIDHGNLKNNFREISRLLSRSVPVLAVVKANAYGHGIIPVSRTLADCGAKVLGVTSIEEALELRMAGVKMPALILGNIYPFENLKTVVKNGLYVTVASEQSAAALEKEAAAQGRIVRVHAKLDTGMNRIGVNVANGLRFIRRISECPHLRLEGLYTHFSGSAEDPKFTRKQLHLFADFVSSCAFAGVRPPFVHCANSAALLRYPESHFSLVRPGISLYGVSPNPERRKPALRPVLSWKSRIVFLKKVPAGALISYAGTYRTSKPSLIATCAFGYADGYRRSLSNKGEVLVRGRRVRVAGRVTMDMTMLDVTSLRDVKVGDEVVLIGQSGREKITVSEVAQNMETSPYEVFCGIAARVPRIHRGY